MTTDRPASAASEATMRVLRDVLRHVPGAGVDVMSASLLPGGLTNRNYCVGTSGRRVVVRLSSEQAALLAIDRNAEWANSVAAAAAGVAPAVLAYVPAAGALVIEWVEAETLTAADLDDSRTLSAVAATCRQLHAGPTFTGDFDMFALQRRYLDLVMTNGYRLPPSYLDFMPQVERVRRAVASRPVASVPCHNDLLAANILRDDDRLWFIDFEYAGNGDPFFELGNAATECEFGTDLTRDWTAAYLGRDDPRLFARVQLQSLCSEYGWSLWGFIQAGSSVLDFDFHAWGMHRYEKAARTFTSPVLPRLFEQVSGG
jgi:thiamine kinase-like enzyme